MTITVIAAGFDDLDGDLNIEDTIDSIPVSPAPAPVAPPPAPTSQPTPSPAPVTPAPAPVQEKKKEEPAVQLDNPLIDGLVNGNGAKSTDSGDDYVDIDEIFRMLGN